MQRVEIVIAGAGIVGLSLALDLRQRGATVTVLERQEPGAGASRAAAGMLAVHDPGNPAQLRPLSERSATLYLEYLRRICELGGHRVPFETECCLEQAPNGQPANDILPGMSHDAGTFELHEERSLDPRKLFSALLEAARQQGVSIRSGVRCGSARREGGRYRVPTVERGSLDCDAFIDCTGAWNSAHARPVKGQMLRVQLPPNSLTLPAKGNVVVRTPEIYLVPRLDGTCLIGATVEDVGFDTVVQTDALRWLRARAARLVPSLASAPEIESWSGLRPASPDMLPVLGRDRDGVLHANGLYRNGILLAPVVTEVLSSMVRGEAPALDVSIFAPRH